MESFLENSLFTITCPTCGSSMDIDHGSVFVCPYCGRKLYVLSPNQCEILMCNQLIPKEVYNHAKECGDKYLENMLTHMVSQNLAEHLIKNGYLRKIKKDSPWIDSDSIALTFSLKVVKPDEEENIFEVIQKKNQEINDSKIAFKKGVM